METYNPQQRRLLIGAICEDFVNDPNQSRAEIARKFKCSEYIVKEAMYLYFGNGEPVQFNIQADE